MHAIIRRYDGVDQNRTAELTGKVNENLVPKLEKLPGFAGYCLVEAGNGVFSSLGLFETPEQGKESTNVVATWIRDEKLETTDPQRAQDHEWPGRRSQRPRHGRRLARPHPHSTEGPACRALSRFRFTKPPAVRLLARPRACSFSHPLFAPLFAPIPVTVEGTIG